MNKIPNILSVLRIITAPFLLFFAWNGYRNLFIGFLIASLLSDAIDGFIARKYNASTPLGTKLDSYGDMAIYCIVPICAWLLWPEIVKKEAVYVFIAIGAYIFPLIAGLMKFRRIPSYHTLGAKVAAIVMSIAIFTLFLTEIRWLFRFASIFQAIVACEEILITIRLPKLQSNVKSLWHLKKHNNQNKT